MAPLAAQENLSVESPFSGVSLRLDKITAAELHTDPYDFILVRGFLDPEVARAINRDYPKIPAAGNKDYERYPRGPAFDAFIDQLTGPAMARALGEKFGVDLSASPTTVTVRTYSELSDGNIHTDHWSKLITVLVYFNTDWADNGGQLRLLRSATDIENYAAEVAPIGGTLLAFRRSDHSWHGHKQFIGERRMLQMNFVKPSRMARYTQQIDRLSTRVMKRIARLVQ